MQDTLFSLIHIELPLIELVLWLAIMVVVPVWLMQRYFQQRHQRRYQTLLTEHQQQALAVQHQADQQAQLSEHLNLLNNDLSASKQQVSQQQQQMQTQLTELARFSEHARHLEQQLEQAKQQADQYQQSSAELQSQVHQLKTQQASQASKYEEQQRSAEEKLALLADNKTALLKEFELLSQKVLEQKSQQVNEQQKQGLDAVLSPFKQQLEGLRKKVEDVHLDDAKDRASLKTQISELHRLNQQMSSDAHALTTALRGEQKVQGNWGEMVLETVLERSGLRQGEEFVREQQHRTAEGQQYRPDVIINLPEGKHVIIDSKVSLSAYTDYVNTDQELEKNSALKRHIESVRGHIKNLSSKSYQELDTLNSPDFVFLFMPIEPAFMLAFQADERLFQDAFEQRVVVVTPTTLLASLRTVSSLWAIERRNRNTEKIADQARLVYEKVVMLVEHMEKLGKQLQTVQNTYDDTWKSLKQGRGNLLSRADNFQKLGVRVKKELPKPLVEEAIADAELHDALAAPLNEDKSAPFSENYEE